MIATTIKSSASVKPFLLLRMLSLSFRYDPIGKNSIPETARRNNHAAEDWEKKRKATAPKWCDGFPFFIHSDVNKINQMKKEKVFLEEQILALQEEEKVLKNDIQKLEDPSYVARYAREKYLYSKEGEYIIRIPE